MKCPVCGGAATRGGKQYGARCKECERFVDDCECVADDKRKE